MSELSAQCDELRAMAESVGLAMPQAATLMMEAADTIWELRESVHREQAEADGLRMRITSLEAALDGMHLIREQDVAENAKLRELVRNLLRVIPADVTGVVIGANTDYPTYYKFDEVFCELGIEVDE